MTEHLKSARVFIAAERDAFIAANTTGPAGEPDMSTLDEDARAMLAQDFDPALSAIDAALIEHKALQDEVTYWRQDAAARLRTAITLARAAEGEDDLERAAQISVGIIFPTRAALANALSGYIYYPLCEGCSKPVQAGDVVFAVGDGEGQTGELHADCERPRLDGHGGDGEALPEGAYLYADDAEFSPEGVAKALAEANAYCGEG